MAAEASGAPDLRPLTTGELIDRGFALYRRNFAGLLLLALLSQAAPLLAQVSASALRLIPARTDLAAPTPRLFLGFAGFLGLVFLSQLVTFALGVVMTRYVADAYLGRMPLVKASFACWWRHGLGSAWTFFINYFFYVIAGLFPILALVAAEIWFVLRPPGSFALLAVELTGALILLVASLVPVLLVFMRLICTLPALAVEGVSGWAACRRSSTLVRYDPGLGFFYWGETRLSLLLLPLFVIQLLFSSLTSVPLVLAKINELVREGTLEQLANPSDVVVVGSQILTYLAGALVVPLYVIAVTLFYYDIRIRREGFDLEHLAARLEARA